ncbi:MAG: peptidase M22 [Oscillospiraceae bacterium]|nr:peptidase M22 [Oscillospiraceae bacterium]
MAWYFGFDTSNYTTSVAAYNSDLNIIVHRKKLLPVKSGERGIRQSNAVFYHTEQIGNLVNSLFEELYSYNNFNISEVAAIGVSAFPRRVEGSYMPCFSVGQTVAKSLAASFNVPCFEFSHQEGHICAALYSAGKLNKLNNQFLAFHVSGGTTESLVCCPSEDSVIKAELIGTSSDLKAGQAIDRIGVKLGLDFPCGPALEKLAEGSTREFNLKPSMNNLNCSLSGVENKCNKMLSEGEKPEDIALFCLKYIESSIDAMSSEALKLYPNSFICYSGGVMSNKIIRKSLEQKYECSFAEPDFSSDNAAGIALLTSMKKV